MGKKSIRYCKKHDKLTELPARKKTLEEKIKGRISKGWIDESFDKPTIHYCTFSYHPGIIGKKILEERECLNGCYYYKKFTEND